MKKSSRKKSIGESLAAFLKCKVNSQHERLGSGESDKSYAYKEKFDKTEKSRWSIPLPKKKKNVKTFVDRGEQTDNELFLRNSYTNENVIFSPNQPNFGLNLPPNYAIVYVNGCKENSQWSSEDSGFYTQNQNLNVNTQHQLAAYRSSIVQNQDDHRVKIQIQCDIDQVLLPNSVNQNNEVHAHQQRLGRSRQVEPIEELTEHCQYEYHEKAIDVPEEFERDAYLVFGINQRRSPFRRKICQPVRLMQPAQSPPESTAKTHWTTSNGTDADNQHSNGFSNQGQQPKPLPRKRNGSNGFGSRLQLNRSSYPFMTSTMAPQPVPNIVFEHVNENRIDSNNILRRSSEELVFEDKRNNNVKSFSDLSKVNNKCGGSLVVLNNQLQVEPAGESVYRRLGGSVQNLFNLNRSNLQLNSKKQFCKSENNLVAAETKKGRIQSFFQGLNRTKVTPFGSSEMDVARERKISEPKNWKTYFTINSGEKKTKVQDNNNKRIQDLDGSFFEKFGSILRQKNEDNIKTPLAALSEESPSLNGECETSEEQCKAEEGDDNTVELRIQQESEESDSDGDGRKSVMVEDLVGWNIDELYEEILYEILHNVGCEDEEIPRELLFSYLQDAFKISNERHEEAMEAAQVKEAPEIRLNVEVIEAKDLRPKDPNGLSDPFVTMYIQSSPTHRFNTTVKSETLCPTWEEHFSLPIAENANEEILVVEVWDFDPAETVREKIRKISDVKGAKGLRKLFKDVIVTASTGKHDNELIGRACIPLNTIPASGRATWFSLEKKLKTAHQGVIRIRLSFSSEKNHQVAAQEHRHLLKMLLLYELENSKVAPYWWSGKFSNEAETILTQHTAQSGLTSLDMAFVRWSVYTDVHASHPLSYPLFESILDKLVRPIQSATASNEEIKLFWEASIRFLPSCFSVVRRIRKLENTDKNGVKTLNDVLNIISKLSALQPPEGTDLYPDHSYSWLRRSDPEVDYSLREVLNDAVHSGALTWFRHVRQESQDPDESNEEKLQYMVKIIQMVRSDLQKAIEYYDKSFKTILQYRYASALYLTYDTELVALIEPVVTATCCSFKQVNYNDDSSNSRRLMNDDINMGTTLFELFMLLKRFAMLGTSLCPADTVFQIGVFHQWFFAGVKHWLDIAVFKAKTRIAKAIELDQLLPVDETVKHSSSAVDTFAIFYQIKVFWQELDWPEVEGAFTFVGKIIDDICYCCDFYAETMSEKIAGYGDVHNMYEKKFVVTQEWCLAINNIDYIRNSLRPFVKDLGTDEIIIKLGAVRSELGAKRCEETLENVIENALDTEKNRILMLIDTVAGKMSPVLRKFLVEGAEVSHQDSNSMDRLMMYLEDSLKMLNSELNELNFERMLDAIWLEIERIMEDIVQTNLDKRRPPSFYANLLNTLKTMVVNFRCANNNGEMVCTDQDNLERVERLLRLHAYETSELIHQYYKDRLVEQNAMEDNPFGQLTIQCFFKDNVLDIEILSARNLLPMNTDGTCDAFVKLHFWPEEKFTNVTKPKTNTQSKTLFPLFEERFEIQLSHEQRAIEDAIIMFSVKDKDYFGMSNKYLAECFISFSEIADITEDSGSIQQILLTLNRPKKLDSECLRALEHRQGDKQAREFLKKLHQKC